MNESNPNLAFSCFMQVLSNTYNDACPVKVVKYTGKTKQIDKPWLTRRLKMPAERKNNLHLTFLKDMSELTESRYKKYKNKLIKLLCLEELLHKETQRL